ncbi:MAG: hypothetical protein QNJ53_17270 [Pleurocapsa sp. MO_192.B19]|nr:hypothetical protein [Pleurocapsa sp. MO_192.B19]
MSTKATVAYGKNFHLYKEIFDENFIYLELEGVQFEASYNRVMIPIPVHIWEVIRQYEGTDLSWAYRTDDEIVRYVEQEVDKRIQKYQQAENEKSGATPRRRKTQGNAHQESKRLIALLGSMPYGNADTPRQQQIEQGITYFKSLREHQQQICQAIEELKQTNQNSLPDNSKKEEL